MNVSNILTAATMAILFSGCASMFVPDSDVINELPIMEMGSHKQKPANNEFVLHIPAGAKIPVNFSVNGSLIAAPVENRSVTQINQELYIYKYWASLDGKNWQPTRDLIKMPIAIGVAPEGGQIHVKVDITKK